MQNKQEFIKNIKMLYLDEELKFTIYLKKYVVDKGIASNAGISQFKDNILSDNYDKITNINILIAIYKAYEQEQSKSTLSQNLTSKPLSYYFDSNEIVDYGNIASNKNNVFPIVIKNVFRLSHSRDEFTFNLSIQEINRLKNSGVIKIIEGMQRESEITVFGASIVSHVKYDDKVARQIAKEIIKDKYHPTSLRWHILIKEDLPADYEYDEKNHTLTINNCIIAEIDGQHRSSAIGYALMENPRLNMNFNILLTIGSQENAQHIINQDEKRQPIDQDQLTAYSDSLANRMVQEIKKRLNSSSYRFYITKAEFDKKMGFISETMWIKYAEQNIPSAELQGNGYKILANEISIILKDLEDFVRVYNENYRNPQVFMSMPKYPAYFDNKYGSINIIALAHILQLYKLKFGEEKYLEALLKRENAPKFLQLLSGRAYFPSLCAYSPSMYTERISLQVLLTEVNKLGILPYNGTWTRSYMALTWEERKKIKDDSNEK